MLYGILLKMKLIRNTGSIAASKNLQGRNGNFH
jgi:hypothetical protein